MKPIRITVSNQKGGVGKTTTVLTLARCFADEGRRVLMIDTDPQGNLWTTLSTQECFQSGKTQFWIHNLFGTSRWPLPKWQFRCMSASPVFSVIAGCSFAESRLAGTTAKE